MGNTSPDPRNCPGCNEKLRASRVDSVNNEEVKACPNCSGRFGRHIYYPRDSFLDRRVDGTEYMQSWCTACRNGLVPEHPVHFC